MYANSDIYLTSVIDNIDKKSKYEEYTCIRFNDSHFRECSVTDYSFLIYSGIRGVPYKEVKDISDKWCNYMVANLQGEDRENYLKGLREFARKVAVSKEKEILESANIEQSQNPRFSLQPKNRIVDRMITEQKIKEYNTKRTNEFFEELESLKEQSKDLFD